MRREWELEDLIDCWTLNEADLAYLLVTFALVTRMAECRSAS